MATLRIAAVQMTSLANWQHNLNHIERAIEQAVLASANCVVLPENALLFDGPTLRAFSDSSESSLVLRHFSNLASQHKIYIIIGAFPMSTRVDGSTIEDGRVAQSCLVYGPTGDLFTRYDKIHLFDVNVEDSKGAYRESSLIEPGQLNPIVVEMAGVKVGLSICYDLRFPELYRSLAEQGAELILVPSAFTYQTGKAHWQILLQARAIENQCFILGVDQCGWHSSVRQTYGHSMLVSPWGDIVAKLDDLEGMLVAEIDLEELRDIRKRMPVLTHRRIS